MFPAGAGAVQIKSNDLSSSEEDKWVLQKQQQTMSYYGDIFIELKRSFELFVE